MFQIEDETSFAKIGGKLDWREFILIGTFFYERLEQSAIPFRNRPSTPLLDLLWRHYLYMPRNVKHASSFVPHEIYIPTSSKYERNWYSFMMTTWLNVLLMQWIHFSIEKDFCAQVVNIFARWMMNKNQLRYLKSPSNSSYL